jgi:hypothetical protein
MEFLRIYLESPKRKAERAAGVLFGYR